MYIYVCIFVYEQIHLLFSYITFVDLFLLICFQDVGKNLPTDCPKSLEPSEVSLQYGSYFSYPAIGCLLDHPLIFVKILL